jgi:hypothetical protein
MKWPFGFVEKKTNVGTVSLELRAWPTYDIKNVHPQFQANFSQFLQSHNLPNSGPMTAQLVNSVNGYFRGNTSRLNYSENSRNFRPHTINPGDMNFWSGQFVTYFGLGVTVASREESLENLDGLKQEIASDAVDYVRKNFPNIIPRPPPLGKVKERRVDVKLRGGR